MLLNFSIILNSFSFLTYLSIHIIIIDFISKLVYVYINKKFALRKSEFPLSTIKNIF